jgi:type I restriction enzyme S subunit
VIGRVRLGDIADVFNGKTPSKAEQRDHGHPVLKVRDVDEHGRHRGNTLSFVDPDLAAKYPSKWVQAGDTLILNAAHNADYVASKTYFAEDEAVGCLATGEWLLVRAHTDAVHPAFVNYWFRSSRARQSVRFLVKGIHLYPKDVADLELALPALADQRRIVDLLARAEGIVRLRREAQQKAAELIPAIFIDMFGDPATNPMGWPVHSLGSLAEVQGGLQVTRARAKLPLERPYLRVANVHRGRLDLTEMKSIRLTETEFTRTALHAGDLLVVEGHGNPQEVGRVATWDDSIPDCTHQNHLIRARPLRDRLLPEYACALLNSEAGRQTLLRAGKTTSGLSTISAQNVKNATVMLPPVADQGAFARHADAVASLTNQQAEAVNKATATFDALLSRAFH